MLAETAVPNIQKYIWYGRFFYFLGISFPHFSAIIKSIYANKRHFGSDRWE